MKNLILLSLAFVVTLISSVSVHTQTASPVVALEPGKPIEQNIALGEKHSYNLTLAAGAYAFMELDQRDINLSITIFGADGQKLRTVDLTGRGVPEQFSIVVQETTTYRFEVQASDNASPRGSYTIQLKETHPATDQDKARLEAEKLTEAGTQFLVESRTRESRLAAIDKFQQSITFWRAAKNDAKVAGAFYLLSYAYLDISEYQKACEAAEQGLPLARAVKDQQSEAYLLDQIGASYRDRGENKKALEIFEQALRVRKSVKDPVGLGVTLNNLGYTYNAIGDMQKSLYYMEQVPAIMREMGERLKESTVLNNICVVNMDLGQYKKAIEFCNESLKMKRELKDSAGEAITLSNLGKVYSSLGDYQKALELHEQARVIHKSLGRRESEAIALHNLGYAYAQLGEADKAKELYTEALKGLREAGNNKRRVAITLTNIANNYADLKDYRQALEIYLQALPLRPEADDRYGRANTLSGIATCYENLGDKQKALEYYTESVRLHRTVGELRQLAITLKNVGVFHREQGETAKALDYLNEARTISSQIGDQSTEAIVLSHLAKLELDRSNLVEARKLIEQAIAAFESLRINLKSQALRASFLASVRKFYEIEIEVLMRLHEQRPNDGFAAAALEVSEKSRARSLLELLREARAEIRQGADPSLIERENYLRRTIAVKAEQQTRLLSGKHTEEDASAAAKEIEDLTTEYDQVQARIRQTSRRYAALTAPQPIRIDEIRKQVDENTLLLEYSLGDEKSFVWAVTPDSVKSFELPGRATIEQAARRVYQLLSERSVNVPTETLAQRKQRFDRADSEYTQVAASLSSMLLGPVASDLKQKRLLIVAEGVLQYIPFSALPSPVSSAKPLIVDHEIVTLPSASVLAVLREETANRKPASKAVAVLADPVFSASDPRLAQVAKGESLAPQDNASLTEAHRSATESGVGDLMRLRFSRQEAEDITRLAGDKRNLKALDFSANRSIATDQKLSDYRIVHFATHGLINNQHPDLSGIVLSLVNEQGQPQNGFLRLYDIYNLKLDADLVVLSACQTALGKEIKGEGLVGLTRGFMYAGAPRVVASFWRIDDRASADIMKRFYEAMFKDGLHPAAALRAAQVSMLREQRWQSPHYWAAFTIQGEWR